MSLDELEDEFFVPSFGAVEFAQKRRDKRGLRRANAARRAKASGVRPESIGVPFPTGEAHPRCRLSDDDIREIRKRRANGEPLRVLAAVFETDVSYISNIARRRVRASVSDDGGAA